MVSSVEDRDSIDNPFYFYLDNEEGKSNVVHSRSPDYHLDFVSQMWSVMKPFVLMRSLAR